MKPAILSFDRANRSIARLISGGRVIGTVERVSDEGWRWSIGEASSAMGHYLGSALEAACECARATGCGFGVVYQLSGSMVADFREV
jgi:hypothetical protein